MILRILFTLGLAYFAGKFWRMGGSGIYSRYWRRLGVAGLLTLNCLLLTWNWWGLLTLLLAFSSFTLGYGIPDETDEGSSVARFWIRVGHRLGVATIPERILRFLTRATVAKAYGINYMVLGYFKGNILGAILAIIGLFLTVPIICNFEWGVEIEERLIGSSILLWTLVI